MKNKFINLIAAFFVVFSILNSSNAQVKTKIFHEQIPLKLLPVSKTIEQRKSIKATAEFYDLKLKAKDSSNTDDIRFAFPVLADIDFLKAAKIFEENGMLVYSLTLIAEDALNLSIQFNQFKLSANSSLSIYTKYELTDSITVKENNESNVWATRVYQGNEVSIVLKTPTSEKEQPMIKIDKVNFGYKKFGVSFDFGNPGASAPCNINANCAGGNGWDNEKNSVAMIVVNGIIQCTGSLIMNSCNTNIPYFLTANHCLDLGNVPNWVFQFQTLSTDCATNTGWREDIQFNGCTLRANNAATDFALLQLNTTPTPTSGLFYSGWSRQTAGITSTTILHHPRGDLMKISRDVNAPTTMNSLGRDVWQLDLDLGRVEGGSSGAPYYNQAHQIVGQHFRRPQNDGTNRPCDWTLTHGGRFDVSWTGGGTNATRLSNWLDPSGSNAITTNTTNISNLFGSLTINGNDNLCTAPNTYTIPNLPAGATVVWSTTPANLTTPSTGTGTTFTISRVGTLNGNVTLTANISTPGCGLVQTAVKPLTVGAVSTAFNASYQVGNGYPVITPTGMNYVPPFQPVTLTLNSSIPGITFTIEKVYGNSLVSTSANTALFSLPEYRTYNPAIGLITLLGKANAACSNMTTQAYNFSTQGQCGGCGTLFSVSPNPATDAIKIEKMDASTSLQKTSSSAITAIELTDKMGNIIYSKNFNSKLVPSSISIPVSQFKNDIYTLRIFNGTVWEVQQIIIQH